MSVESGEVQSDPIDATCIPEQQEKIDVLVEIERLLKPGGILHMVEFCNEDNNIFKSKFGVIMHHQTPSDLNKLVCEFKELSFNVVKTQTMSGHHAHAVSYFGHKNT